MTPLSLFLSLSHSVSFPLSLICCLCSHFHSHPGQPFCLSLVVSLTPLSLTVFLSPSLSLAFSPSLSLSFSPLLSRWLSLPLSHGLSLPLSHGVSPLLSLSPSLPLSDKLFGKRLLQAGRYIMSHKSWMKTVPTENCDVLMTFTGAVTETLTQIVLTQCIHFTIYSYPQASAAAFGLEAVLPLVWPSVSLQVALL